MSAVAAYAVPAGFAIATLLVVPAIRRTGLGLFHPAIAWLGLEVVFFGLGSVMLAVTEARTGPALDVAGWVVAFGLGVAASNRWAGRRLTTGSGGDEVATDHAPLPETGGAAATVDSAGVRWPIVLGLVALGVAALLPTLLSVGLPALATDITGTRTEIGGLDLQVLRVALPAGAIVGVLAATAAGRTRLLTWVAVALAALAEIALASRYLVLELFAALVVALTLAGRPLAIRVLAIAAVAALALFVAIGVLRAYGEASRDPLAFAADRTVNRIVLIQPRTLDAIQTAIPDEVPYFGGLTWFRRIAPLVGRDDVPNLGYWIYARMFPDQDLAGYAAPGLVGEAWANFGPFGVVIAVTLGVVVERLGALIALRRRLAVDIAAGALATIFVARTHAVGLAGLAILVLLLVVWRVLAAPLAGLLGDVGRTVRWRT